MANTNTQIDSQEPLKKASDFLTPEQQSLGQLAFETQVEPLRASFGKRLDQTTESLARRGAFFGGTGQEQFREKLLKPQLQAESQIAGNIATTLGQTAIQQAFQISEAAKNRQLQQSLQESGFEFQRGQAEDVRGFQSEQAQLGREFASGESELGRSFAEQENKLGRDLTQTESQFVRDFQEEQANLQRQASEGSQEAAFQQQEKIARLQADFQGDQLQAQQSFSAEQNLLNRTLTQEESALQKDFQTAFQQAGFGFAADEASLDRQDVRNNQAIQLALSGNITGESVEGVIEDLFGEGAILSSDDELTLQRLASSSGLSVEDYINVRETIGTSQMLEMLKNPEEFIDSPEAARAFQLELARLETDAAKKLTEAQGESQRSSIREKGEQERLTQQAGRILPSCVLSTACYRANLITSSDLFDFVRYRIQVQSKSFFSNQIWSGYVLAFKDCNESPKNIHKYIVGPWHKWVKFRLGKGKFSFTGLLAHSMLVINSLFVYLFNRKACKKIQNEFKGKSLISIYKRIVRRVKNG